MIFSLKACSRAASFKGMEPNTNTDFVKDSITQRNCYYGVQVWPENMADAERLIGCVIRPRKGKTPSFRVSRPGEPDLIGNYGDWLTRDRYLLTIELWAGKQFSQTFIPYAEYRQLLRQHWDADASMRRGEEFDAKPLCGDINYSDFGVPGGSEVGCSEITAPEFTDAIKELP